MFEWLRRIRIHRICLFGLELELRPPPERTENSTIGNQPEMPTTAHPQVGAWSPASGVEPQRHAKPTKADRKVGTWSRWSSEEFEILLENPQLTPEDLSIRLPRRTVGAIQIVRSFIHSFHLGGDISGLSQMMRRTLDERRGTVTCPVCRAVF